MDHLIIHKQPGPDAVFMLQDYERARADFTWDEARSRLSGLPGGGLNIGYEAVDRHLTAGRGGREALRCIAADGTVTHLTYAELGGLTGRFANVLTALGVGRQERVFTLLGRCPELYTTVLGTLRSARVLCPLFSAFGPEPVRQRLQLGDARVLVTTEALYRRKVEENRQRLPRLDHVLLVGPVNDPPPGTVSFAELMEQAQEEYAVPPTDPEDMALLHFTSGTTGTPKGAVHVHDAVVAHHATAAFALDLQREDVYWCGGPRVGDRYLLRDHRPAHPRRDCRGGRGGLRRPPLVPHPRRPAGHGLVHGTDREHGHALARGVPADAVMAEMYGKATGCSRGRGGSMHLFDATRRFYGGNAIVAGGLPLAAGLALADRMRGSTRVTCCFFGDGAFAEGEFHETANLAALWQLPLLLVCENNLYAMGTSLAREHAQTNLAMRAASYGMPAWTIDGMDVLAVEAAARRATESVRAGNGPHFLEAQTYRFRAHSMYDPDRYRAKSEIEEWMRAPSWNGW